MGLNSRAKHVERFANGAVKGLSIPSRPTPQVNALQRLATPGDAKSSASSAVSSAATSSATASKSSASSYGSLKKGKKAIMKEKTLVRLNDMRTQEDGMIKIWDASLVLKH